MKDYKRWAQHEITLLDSVYENKTYSIDDIVGMFPGRSYASVSQMARRRGLCRKRHWTTNDVQILEKHYPRCGTMIVPYLSKPRSRAGISGKAHREGIKTEGWYYTPEEDQVIIQMYPVLKGG